MKERDKDERTAAEHNQDSYKTDPPEEDRRVGTFGGEEDRVVRRQEGRPVPGDTGNQGGGQN